ncbi:hypothetical protein [Embleya sp. NPDC005971]|uniref:hypothetical protein n=1 Tax=Embleya sp. NPDC005971 TaxID=3156724 RepID=UPI0033FCF4BD
MSDWPTWSLIGDDAALARYVVPDEVAGLVRELPPKALLNSPIAHLRAVYEALAAHGILYDHEEPTTDSGRQVIREPGEVLWSPGRGTCLDLALVMAGACLKAGLHPIVVLVDSTSGGASHALLGVWVRDAPHPVEPSGVWHSPPSAWGGLTRPSPSGRRPPLVLVDPVGIARGLPTAATRGLNADFDEAARSATHYTPFPDEAGTASWAWRVGVDVKHLWRAQSVHPTTSRPAGDPLREPYISLDTVPEAARTPMQLLRADYGIVPFEARDELTVLADWCHTVAAGRRTGIAVVHGPGGAGKTRLALELAQRMRTRHDWYTGYLKSDEPLDWLGAVVTPTLIVVDYADAASDRTRELLRILGLRRGAPAAVVMTARSVEGDWLDDLRASWTRRGQLCDELRLRLPSEHPARSRLFRSAMDAYAAQRDPGATPQDTTLDALVPDRWSTLDYVLLGLLAARREGPLPATRGDLYDEVLDHERRYWAQTHQDLTGTRKAPTAVLARAAACLTLRAPTTDAQAHAALRAVEELSDDGRWREEVRTTLTTCLRPGVGEPLVVRPDPIGDHLTIQRLADDPALLERVLNGLEPDPLHQTLLHFNRAAAADPETANSRLLTWIDAGANRWEAVLPVASAQGGAALATLELAVRRPRTPTWLDELARALPEAHTGLVHLAHDVEVRRLTDLRNDNATPTEALAAQLTRLSPRQADIGEHNAALLSATEGVDHYRALAQANPATFLPGLAGALNGLSNRQSETGNRKAALSSGAEAVNHYRVLARADAATFLSGLAAALNNLSTCRGATGDRNGALTASTEAVDHYRTLANADPATFLSGLAAALNNLSISRDATGDRNGALTASTEAVDHYRTLANADPAAFLPDLAASLNNLSNRQSESGKRDAALISIVEAVQLRRTLAQTNAAAFLPDLAMSLNNLSNHLRVTGDRNAALASATEAVDHFRALAQADAATFLPSLAASLNTLSSRQRATGDRHAALASVTEGVDHYRTLAQDDPAAFLPDLAASLDNLANCQSETGNPNAALTSITEAVGHYRELAQDGPAAFLPDLASSLNTLSVQQSRTGNREAARTSSTEAVEHYRTLAKADPTAFLPRLATSLTNLSNHQSATGNRDAALVSSTEAVRLQRPLAQADPATFLSDLAASLNTLSTCQIKTGDRHAALTSSTEAVDHYRTLTDANPETFLPHLATSLTNLSNCRFKTGNGHAALTSSTEAVHHYRTLAQDDPATFRPRLAMCLNNLSVQQSQTGNQKAALTLITEVVDHYRALVQDDLATFLPHLATSLNNLSVQQSQTGNQKAALISITEAVDLHRTLAQDDPTTFLPDLAMSLTNLANCQSENGSPDAALTSITEAVDHHRALAQDDPAAFLPDLAMSLNNLSSRQSDAGDPNAALTSITEAVDHHRALARDDPAAFLPDLAMSLENFSLLQTDAGLTKATWLGVLDDLRPTPIAMAELRTRYARYLMDSDRSSEATDQLVQAAAETYEGSSHRLGLTRRAIRDVVLLGKSRDERLPAWAVFHPDDECAALLEAWAEIETWAGVEAFVTQNSTWLRTAAGRTDLDAAQSLYPGHAALGRLAETFDAIARLGVATFLAESRDDNERRAVVKAWLDTPTWDDSIRFLAEHADELHTPAVRQLLTAAGDTVDSRRHRAILDLSEHMAAADVLALLTDPSVAANHALDAIEHADVPWMTAVLAACPPVLENHDANAAVLTAVLALADGSPDEARACAMYAAEHADDLQRRAHAIRLRALHHGRPDLEAAAELVDIINP